MVYTAFAIGLENGRSGVDFTFSLNTEIVPAFTDWSIESTTAVDGTEENANGVDCGFHLVQVVTLLVAVT